MHSHSHETHSRVEGNRNSQEHSLPRTNSSLGTFPLGASPDCPLIYTYPRSSGHEVGVTYRRSLWVEAGGGGVCGYRWGGGFMVGLTKRGCENNGNRYAHFQIGLPHCQNRGSQ